jgi:hypothetical protein
MGVLLSSSVLDWYSWVQKAMLDFSLLDAGDASMAAGISNRQFRVLLACFLRDQKLHEKQSKTSMNNHVKRIHL